MRKDKKKAFELRTSGKSYSEIRELLGVPKATLSDWFHGQDWSDKLTAKSNKKHLERNVARIVHLGNIRGANLKRLYEEARKEAAEEFELLKNHPLFVAGVMMYWGEGDKVSKHAFRVTNSDPAMIKLFLQFLLKVCRAPEERVRAALLIYPDLDAKICEAYWAKSIGLPRSSFAKTVVIKGRHAKRRLQHGVCTLYFPSRFLKEKMLVWILLMPRYLGQ